MKTLKTLGLAGLIAISACTTPQHLNREHEHAASIDTAYVLTRGTDRMLEDMTDEPLRQRLANGKKDIRYDVTPAVREAFAKRYYGLDAISRQAYLMQDLLTANEHVRRLEASNKDHNAQTSRYTQRIQELQGQVRWLRSKLDDKPEVIYQTRIVERTPTTRTFSHPVERNLPFIRLGDEYYQFPFAQIVCPGLDAPEKACIDINDVIEDHRDYTRSQDEEWRNPVRIREQ